MPASGSTPSSRPAARPSRAAAQRLIERGAVSVDGRPTQEHRIGEGERVAVEARAAGPGGSRAGAVAFEIV